MERQVAIIGAGISGLLACKYCLSKGFRPTVFEIRSSIGGVWTKTVETTKLQTSKLLYQFSDFPWPPSVTEEFPTQQEVFDYLQSYATHFDLLRHVRFNSKAIKISYEGPNDSEMNAWAVWGGTGEPFSSKGKWNLTVQDTRSLSTEVRNGSNCFLSTCIALHPTKKPGLARLAISELARLILLIDAGLQSGLCDSLCGKVQ